MVVIIYFIRISFITFNVCRAEQTEAWTHLEWFLEQLFLSQDLKIF